MITGQAVADIEPGEVTIGGQVEKAGCIIWGAGVRASPVAAWLGVAADRSGRVSVAPDLSVPGLDGIYVIGDSAAVLGPDGKPLPALAQVAHQEGLYLGRALRRNLDRRYADAAVPISQPRQHGGDRPERRRLRDRPVADQGLDRLGDVGASSTSICSPASRSASSSPASGCGSYLTYQSGARLIADDARRTTR